jgi:8-oxo-dGTP diphosphatase
MRGVSDGRERRALIEAAGGLVWRRGAHGPELAVVHRPHRRDWSLPKGKLKDGESFKKAARREVAEETGCRTRLGAFAGHIVYPVKDRLKLVLFWHMVAKASGKPKGKKDRFEANDEIDALEWLAPARAIRRLDHPAERRLVRKVRPPAALVRP